MVSVFFVSSCILYCGVYVLLHQAPDIIGSIVPSARSAVVISEGLSAEWRLQIESCRAAMYIGLEQVRLLLFMPFVQLFVIYLLLILYVLFLLGSSEFSSWEMHIVL